MKGKEAFFVFLLLVVVAGFGFGVYAKDIQCSKVASVSGLECFRLYLAFGVLFAVAVLLAVAAAFYALIPPPEQGDHPGKQIFDTLSKSLLPVVTLVLGYYFGSSQTQTQGRDAAAVPSAATANGANSANAANAGKAGKAGDAGNASAQPSAAPSAGPSSASASAAPPRK